MQDTDIKLIKELILSDEKLTQNFLIYYLHKLYKTENPKEHTSYYLDEYNTYNDLINDNDNLHRALISTLKDLSDLDTIDKVINDYRALMIDEGKQFIYSLSRLLYIQNKYSNDSIDDSIGQQIDTKIRKWLNYIKSYDRNEVYEILDPSKKLVGTEAYNEALNMMSANTFYFCVVTISERINTEKSKFSIKQTFYDLELKQDIKDDITSIINGYIADSKLYVSYSNLINDLINTIEDIINMENFNHVKESEIKAIKEKYKDNKSEPVIIYKDIETTPELNELTELYIQYTSENESFKIQDNKDIKIWRDKAKTYIDYLTKSDIIKTKDIAMFDYILDHLAYSDYQKKAYSLKRFKKDDDITPKRKRLSAKELKEKYQDTTLVNDETLNPNKKWALVDTNKHNNNIMNMRENIIKLVDSNPNITQRKIDELKRKENKSQDDLDDIKELEATKKEQEQHLKELSDEINDLKADLDLLNKNIESEQDDKRQKEYKKLAKETIKKIKEKKDILNSEGVYFQMNTEGYLTYEKTSTNAKDKYELIIPTNYDIQNFNQEGRNFLQYVINVDNIVNKLNDTYINIDMNKYASFYGIKNPRRTRKKLFDTLKEMGKERYNYSYTNDKGERINESLILVGDVRTIESKNKINLEVQLGGKFKENIQDSIIKGQIAHVNKDIFKLGHGKQNKSELRAKELYLYFVKLARIETKKGLITGAYEKVLKISTLIDYLKEINLLNYNTSRYNDNVKDPLQIALYTGMDLGLYEIVTDAFKYYDDAINTLNNGAYNKDKIANFENQLIKIVLHNDNIDTESNQRAYETYKSKNKSKKKSDKKATKK